MALGQDERRAVNQTINALENITRAIHANTEVQKKRYALERETFEYSYGEDALRVFDRQQTETKES
jgi:hypothetical protein